MSTLDASLDSIEIWPKSAVSALESYWLTSVSQVLSLAQTPEGIVQIEAIIKLDRDTVKALISQTRAMLSPAELRALEIPVDHRDHGLGALRPHVEDERE